METKTELCAEGAGEQLQFDNLLEHCADYFETLLRSVFDERRDFFVHQLAACLREAGVGQKTHNGCAESWMQIESLSGLRGVVGGRFQNLRERWTAAGLPLREHRGDKSGDYQIDERGWIELSNWILKQGYEARLAPANAEHLFELRAIAR